MSQILARLPSLLAVAMDLALTQASRQERRVITGRGSQIPAGLLSLRAAVTDLALARVSHQKRLADMALVPRLVPPPAPPRRMAMGLAPVPLNPSATPQAGDPGAGNGQATVTPLIKVGNLRKIQVRAGASLLEKKFKFDGIKSDGVL